MYRATPFKFSSIARAAIHSLNCVLLFGFFSSAVAGTDSAARAMSITLGVAVRGQAQTSILESGKTSEAEIAGGESHVYTVELASDHYLRVVIEQRGIDLVAVLSGPDGKKLREVNGTSGIRGEELVSVIAEASGQYRIEIRPVQKTATRGRYVLKTEAVRAATAEDRQRIAADLAFGEGERLRAVGTGEARQSAISKYLEALRSWQSIGDQPGSAKAFDALGEIYRFRGDLEKALEQFRQALAVYQTLNDRWHEADLNFKIGWVKLGLAEFQESLDHYNRAVTLFREISDRASEASILVAMGVAAVALGDHGRALTYYDQALEAWRAVKNQSGEGQTFINIGRVQDSLGNKSQALESFNRALSIFQTIKTNTGVANALGYIGEVHASMDEKQKALEIHQQALELWKTSRNRNGEAIALANIADAYEALGDVNKALEHLITVLEIHRTSGNKRSEANALFEMGRLHRSTGEYARAIELLKEALSILQALGFRRGEATILLELAHTESARGNLEESLEYAETAFRISESIRTRVSSRALRSSYFGSVLAGYELLTDVLMRLHEKQPSKAHHSKAFELNERSRARSLLEMLSESQVDIRQGLDTSLLLREQTLRKQLSAKAEYQLRLLSGKHTPQEATMLEKEISALTSQYRELDAELRTRSPRYAALTRPEPLTTNQIQEQVLDTDTVLLEYALGTERSYLWLITRTTIEGYQLPRREEIDAAAQQLRKLVTARQSVHGETEQQFKARIAKADAEYPVAAQALSQLVLGPVASRLATKRLLIVPDGALQYVPFSALPAPRVQAPQVSGNEPGKADTDRGSSLNFRALTLDHEIVMLPSASTLAVLRREIGGRQSAAKSVAVLADPVFDREDDRVAAHLRLQAKSNTRSLAAAAKSAPNAKSAPYMNDVHRAFREVEVIGGGGNIPRLPFSREEAEAILETAPARSALKATGFRANKAMVTSPELSQFRIVHFATHGLLNNEHPELSGIVLSLVDEQGSPQDGFLRVHDLYNLNLPAELVVLSACETALGKEIRGEGLVGLTRGFMYAGAARVMASLWKVDDAATAELMKQFYQQIFKKGASPAAALKAAQTAMSEHKRWRSPYYWSGFVLQGEFK